MALKAHPADNVVVRRRIAGELVRIAGQQDFHRDARVGQMPADGEAVPAVVAAPADDGDETGQRAEFRQDELGRVSSGILHQHDAGHAIVLDRAAIDLADLPAGEDEGLIHRRHTRTQGPNDSPLDPPNGKPDIECQGRRRRYGPRPSRRSRRTAAAESSRSVGRPRCR